MRTNSLLIVIAMLSLTGTTFGAGGGSMPASDMPRVQRAAQTPEEQARDQYNAGVKLIAKADQLVADASQQDERKRQKAQAKAETAYGNAMKKFVRATELQPSMHEAWNYLGYSNRKLGNYEGALLAYDRALQLKPGYPEAIEYRGHAYLGLNRLSEAQDAYLALYASQRKLAAQLLAGMQEWIAAHRANPGGLDVDAFAAWVSERSAIAGKTASLTREGANAAW